VGELGATIMVYPATWKTLPVTIFGLTDRGEVFNAAASTCLLLVVTLVALVLLSRIKGRAALR
jgi:2-aminoethylphosphonate transport system permease protein